MAGARRRLLFLSPVPPPPGGIATWMLAVLGSPLCQRFDVRVVNSSPSETDVVQGRSRLRLDRVGDALRILARFGLELIRFRPEVLHVNTSYYWAFLRDGLGIWLGRAAGARTVLHFRGGDFPEFALGARGPLRRAIEATLRRADRLVALTHHTRVYLESVADPARVRYVPNFVRVEDVGEPPDRSARGEGAPLVLFVGWILEKKGVRELLEAARRLPEARFVLVGPEEPSFAVGIRDALAALGDRVRLLPQRPRAELMELYHEADIFVLPTWREGFPNVVLEAMAAGLPVVATTIGAIPDVIRDGVDGLLVPARDAGALANALRRLAADPALRRAMGARARERVQSTFSVEAVVGQLESLYSGLLDEP